MDVVVVVAVVVGVVVVDVVDVVVVVVIVVALGAGEVESCCCWGKSWSSGCCHCWWECC